MAELELKNESDSPEAKKSLMSRKIGTHNGTFHCDEALACFMLKQLPEYKHADIIRTRNPEELAKCDVVVDVGGVYDPDKHRYDHQRYENKNAGLSVTCNQVFFFVAGQEEGKKIFPYSQSQKRMSEFR